MRRRDLLASLALAASAAEAQEPSPESIYIPKAHVVEDRKFLHEFMDDYSFVDLVTASPTIRITHIPAVLDRTAGPYGTIFGHVSKNNPQNQISIFLRNHNGQTRVRRLACQLPYPRERT